MRERDSLLTRTARLNRRRRRQQDRPLRHDTAASGMQVLEGRSTKRGLGRILPFLGPAFIACIAYMDPGNFATNISAGAQFGYLLVWVIVVSNLMAMLIQSLSAKLGIATGLSLPEVCRAHFPPPVVIGLWVCAELVAIATDLAEFLGAALGFNLLFHIPLLPAGLITAIATFLILGLERYGFRPMEAVIYGDGRHHRASATSLETFLGKPDFGQVGQQFPAAEVRRHGERAARRRHPRRDGDAARHLSPLRADAAPHHAEDRQRGAPPLPLRGDRCRHRDGHRGLYQCGDAPDGRRHLPRARADAYRRDCGRAQDPGADPRQERGRHLRRLARLLRPLVLGGRHDERADHHAGLPAPAHPALGAAGRDDAPLALSSSPSAWTRRGR